MVRNESDLVEAFVRHHARLVDALYVVDHRSEDGTREILQALAAEGLPLDLALDDHPAQRQPETIGALARRAFAAGAQCVILLDADEFLKLPDRAAFERWIGALPAGLCAALDWQTYVPDPAAASADPLAGARRRRTREAHGLHKVVLTQAFADAPSATVGLGNHVVLLAGAAQDLSRQPVRLARVPAQLGALAHLPVRNVAQLRRKIALGWRAHVAAARADPTLNFHWRELYAELERGDPSPSRLQEIACNYGVPMARWEPAAAIPLVDDPLPLASFVPRYAALARALDVTF